MKLADIVLLSTADWDNPFWTNKQHVAVTLARLGHKVLYVDSLGLRRPSATARDLRRIFRRLLKAARPPRKVRDNLWVWSPIVLPWHGNRAVRHFNRALLAGGLRLCMGLLGLRKEWLWTYNPMTMEFVDIEGFSRRIYHCVDEIKAQPGMPVALLERAESKLTAVVDVVFATSPSLARTRKQWNSNTYYLPNVADYEHFSQARSENTILPEDLASIREPRLGFIGAISGYKLDFNLLRHIALVRSDWSIVLIGEVGEGDPWTDSSLLEGLPNLHLLGPRSYADLPAYLKGFDVALLPNVINEYTDSMFPMKFFEYLAAGCPVVSTNLKAIVEYGSAVTIADSTDAFVAALSKVLAGDVPPLDRRLELARAHTYEVRTQRMLKLIDQPADRMEQL